LTLDDASDQLYGSGLDEFVAERARLAKELRDAGKRDDAETLARSRKPTVAAWVLNQLARRNRHDIDLLLDAGHRLREAQAGVLSGEERDAFERARKAESDVLRRLSREAETLLARERGGSTASTLNWVEETLRIAAISATGRETLPRGRFVEPLKAEGFDVVSQLSGPATKQSATRANRTAQKDELRKANEEVKEARARLREAERNALDAEREAKRLSREAEKARTEADSARADADLAAQEVADAETRLKRARRS